MFKIILAALVVVVVTGCASQPLSPAHQARLDKEWAAGKRTCHLMMRCYDITWEDRLSNTALDYN